MANWSDISFAPLQVDYIARLEALRTRSQAGVDEVENARDGQATLLARIQQCMVVSIGFTQDLSANGYKLTNLATPTNPSDAATKAYADGLVFAAVLPAQAGNAGKEITTNGVSAQWGITAPGAIAILNFLNY